MIMEAMDMMITKENMMITMREDTEKIMEAMDTMITTMIMEAMEKIMGTATKKRPIANAIVKIRNVMDIIAKKN